MYRIRHLKQLRLRAPLCRARGALLVAIALALPHAAYPYSLLELLRLPLENLLYLEISLPDKSHTERKAAPPRAGASLG